MRAVLLVIAAAGLVSAQPTTTFEDRPAFLLSNGKLDVAVLPTGATLASLVMKGDPATLSPLWNPIRLAKETKGPQRFGFSIGHFVCVDGFGGVSAEEQKAGLNGHGEAYKTEFQTTSYKKEGGVTTLILSAQLPLLQEKITRTMQMVDNEPVVYVRSRLESMTAFDRPISWAEHATIGAPFLEPGVTVVDMPATRSKTRPHEGPERGPTQHRLPSDKEFQWPMAPQVDGSSVDIRAAPTKLGTGDHTTTLLDRSRDHVWVTAINPKQKRIVGWVFKAEDFPWLQNWEHYPTDGALARGLEFSTQPFDIPRRDAVEMNGLFDAPTFRWLPAKSAIETTFVILYGAIPDGFDRVSDVRVEKGRIVLVGPGGRQMTFAASLPL